MVHQIEDNPEHVSNRGNAGAFDVKDDLESDSKAQKILYQTS